MAGKYRLVHRLARGGMGSIWRALHVDLQAEVALKFIRPDAADHGRSRERFRREARVLAQLRSPHVVQVLDFGIHDEQPYIAMEFLHGEDLGLLLERRGTLTPREAFPLVCGAARGLGVAHEANVVHRDVKPSNLFLIESDGRATVKLIDFGIAKISGGDSNETAEGIVLGSPAFMSPEQARGGKVDLCCDVWSLAAVAYRMLTGHAPIEGTNPSDTVVRICTETPLPASVVRPELGPMFDELFEQAFRRSPTERFPDVGSFAQAWTKVMSLYDPTISGLATDQGAPRAASRGPATGARHETTSVLVSPSSHDLNSHQGQGRDGETASISVARSPAATEQAKKSRYMAFGHAHVSVTGLALLVIVAFAVYLNRGSAPTNEPLRSHARAPTGEIEWSSQPSTQVSSHSPETASSVVEVHAAQPSPTERPRPSRRARPGPAEGAASAGAQPVDAGTPAPATDPVFGLPVAGP